MKLCNAKYAWILGVIAGGGMALATAKVPLMIDYREAMFNNMTDSPVEIGYFHKSGQHSPSTFQSSGFIPAKTTAKKTVRLGVSMVARTPETNTQFIVSAGDKWFKISGSNKSLAVTKVLAEAQK